MNDYGIVMVEPQFITPAENRKNTRVVITDWMLGPEDPSNEPSANRVYWAKLGNALQMDEKDARRRRCSNCEYYDNTPQTQSKMDRIPRNEWDENAGFRGFCHKFRFICHDMRSCQAWEEKSFESEGD
jgi:hypothetical protein